MTTSFVQQLFDSKEESNPENHELIVKKAFAIVFQLKARELTILGVSANYTRKKGWIKNPKISVKSEETGRISVNLYKEKTPQRSKFLIAVLYAVAYLENRIKSADLFYNDKHGQTHSIASRHGPEKSRYMQTLISKLNEDGFLLELEAALEHPLPEHLNEIQISLISASEQGFVSEDNVISLMEVHDCKANDILNEFDKLKVIMEEDHRIPNSINFPSINQLEHEKEMEEKLESLVIKSKKLEHIKITLENELETIKQDLELAEYNNTWLLRRSLLSRVFNRRR